MNLSPLEIGGICVLAALLGAYIGAWIAIKYSKTAPPRTDGSDKLARDSSQLIEQLNRMAGHVDAQVSQRLGKLEELLTRTDKKLSLICDDSEPNKTKQPPEPEPQKVVDLIAETAGTYQPDPSPKDHRHKEILRYNNQGVCAAEIARRLRTTVGEVELILSLQRHADEIER